MIRTLIAASLILGAGSAFAQTAPTQRWAGAASNAQTLGDTASPGFPYGYARPAPRRDVETTGSVVPRASHERVMGLPVPGSY